MNFTEFCAKSYPEKSVFDRKQFDPFTNFVKWFAMRFGYFLFQGGVTANTLDVLALLLSFLGFFFFSTARDGHIVLPFLGIALLYFHIFVDFVDGTLAKASGTTSLLGHYLDEIGCDIDRMLLLVLFGVYTGKIFFILGNCFAVGILIRLAPLTKKELPTTGKIGALCRLYVYKYSFLSVRFMLAILPLLLGLVLLMRWDLQLLSTLLSLFYEIAAVVWLFLCIPQFKEKAKVV